MIQTHTVHTTTSTFSASKPSFTPINPDSIPGLYSWQKECLNQIIDKDAIVAAPTGAGKTKIAYIWMRPGDAIQNKTHKILYTVPIKALANEKYKELQNIYGEKNIGIETGDVKKEVQAPIIVCTQEIYTRKYTRKKINAYIVIDEFHYIFQDQKRSRAYIDGIRFALSSHKFLIMSATLGDPELLQSYLLRITRRNFIVYQTDFRPTELVYSEEAFDPNTLPPHSLVYLFNTKAISMFARFLTTKKPPLPLLKRRKISKLASQYNVSLTKFPELNHGIAQYHSKMSYTEKKFIEYLIKEQLISIILATNALGVGVNLPVKYVMFASTLRPVELKQYERISKIEFIQLSGRAGRKGYFDTGYVHFCTHNFTPYESPTQLEKNYKELLNAPSEKPQIQLHIDIEKIVKQQTTIQKEIEYVIKYSLPQRDPETVQQEAEIILNELNSIPPETQKHLPEFYFPELGISQSARLIQFLLDIKTSTREVTLPERTIKIRKKYVDAMKLPINNNDEITTLMLKRKIARSLNFKSINNATIEITQHSINLIEEQIKNKDPLLLM